MNQIISRIEDLIDQGVEQFSRLSEMELTHKPAPGKWSRQEILGHLIDSGINNLQGFTEIQFFEKPCKIREYRQDELVKDNDYQNADLKGIIDFWRAINCRIMKVISNRLTKHCHVR